MSVLVLQSIIMRSCNPQHHENPIPRAIPLVYYLVTDTFDDTFVIVTETHASVSWSHSVRDVLLTPMRYYSSHSAQNFVDGLCRPYYYKLLYSSPNPITADDIPELLI